jgi:hypothetical protein
MLAKAVRSSLSSLAVAPDRVIPPLLAAVYRAPLGRVDFSVFLTGRTGTFKTALATLCQQHFGAAMDAGSLPANFASTANALEELSFSAKDTLMVVDDFVATGGVGDNALHGIAERLFRAAGNHQGRTRMGGRGQLRAPRPPRALLLATGEEVPRGHSLRARLLIVELRQCEGNRTVLNRCQRAGQDGRLASAMGGYLAWIASRYEELQGWLTKRVQGLRGRAYGTVSAVHGRLPATMAELKGGWEIWLQFALDIGAVNSAEQAQLERRADKAFDEVAAAQLSYHQASDPALRFLRLLQVARAHGHAYVADRQGGVPDCPERWGWRRTRAGWVAGGTRIGWVKENDLFLEPAASYEVAQQIAGAERLPVGAQTLRHRLREQGLLASVDAAGEMLLVRRTMEGTARQVLHLKTSDLLK